MRYVSVDEMSDCLQYEAMGCETVDELIAVKGPRMNNAFQASSYLGLPYLPKLACMRYKPCCQKGRVS